MKINLSNSPRRLLVDLLYDRGVPIARFAEYMGYGKVVKKGITKHPDFKLKTHDNRTPEQQNEQIIKYLISLGYTRAMAELWDSWVDPSNEDRKPRLVYILAEYGISQREAAKALGKKLREEFRFWCQRPITPVGGTKSIVVTVERNLIPYLRNDHNVPSSKLENWRERITPEQRQKELNLEEPIMSLTSKQRQDLHLKINPFSWIPHKDDEYFNLDGNDDSVSEIIEAVEDGIIKVVTGPIGSGKSTLKRQVIKRMQSDESNLVVDVRSIINKRFDGVHILDEVYEKLTGRNIMRHSLRDKSSRIVKELTEKAKEGKWAVIIIDNSHRLEIPDLHDIKEINEVDFQGKRLCAFVLFGQNELSVTLRANDCKQVRLRSELLELNHLGSQLVDYLKHRLEFAMADGYADTELLAPDAWDRFAEIINRTFDNRITCSEAHKQIAKVLKCACEMRAENSIAQLLPVTAKVVDQAFNSATIDIPRAINQ